MRNLPLLRMDKGRKLYSLPEAYRVFYKAMRTIRYMSKSRKNNEVSLKFMERIMLAVTQVNACAVCSYAHTKMALEAGMSSEEIQHMLANTYGIAGSSFLNRFKGRPDQRSNLLYEITMLITIPVFIPVVLIHVIFAALFRIPLI